MLIPRIFHQIWVGPDPFPDEYAAYQQTWLKHHPGWELRFWTEDNLPADLRRPEAAERLRAPAERANILRLELLWRQGGVYMDTDFECLRSIETLIDQAELFITLAKPGRVNNALMGSVPAHPVIDEALDQIRPVEAFGHDKTATGTRFLDALLIDRPGVTLLDHELFYPQTPEATTAAYAVHYKARSWKDSELLRIDLERAEQRAEKADLAARKWKLRYTRTAAELDQLKQSWPHRINRLSGRLLRREFPDPETFCLVSGYNRSGHSLVGSLLDAHPDVVIGQDVSVMRLVAVDGISRTNLLELLLKSAQAQAERPKGRRSTGYSYEVPGQWQGRFRKLRVIGSKEGERTSSRIKRNSDELATLQRRVGVPLRILHVTRNPYDIVARTSTITKNGTPERSLSQAIDLFDRFSAANDKVIQEGKYPVLTVRLELLVKQPEAELRTMCDFLGVDADSSYLEACAGIVFASPQLARESIDWEDEDLEAVQQVIDRRSFLTGYSWTSTE